MTLPFKTYRYINYFQLAVSVYALIWLEKFFVASVSCNMIENQTAIQSYLLRFGNLMLPECSAGGSEWVISPGISVLLRIVMVAWIVFSIYVFFRLRKISNFMSSSEPVEFMNDYSSGLRSGEEELKGIDSISFKIKKFFANAQVKRWIKIVFLVTGVWVLVLIIFQGPLLRLVSRYVEEEKFFGNINSVNVKYVGDDNASISLVVGGKPIILNSEENIVVSEDLLDDGKDDGHFVGLEKYDLQDPLLSECLVGTPVEVYAKRSGVFYTLSGSDRYYIRFASNGPSCQKNYVDKCVIGGESYKHGDVVYLNEDGLYCECSQEGLSCGDGAESLQEVDSEKRCDYAGEKYSLNSEFSSKDGCSRCRCTDEGVNCSVNTCESGEYQVEKEFEVPLYFWYVNEPEPSDYIYVSAGQNDTFSVLSENTFGESPRTELSLDGGNAVLIFSVSHVGVPISSPEIVEIIGNQSFPGLLRVYSPQSGKYLYSRGEVNGVCKGSSAYSRCVSSVVGNLQVECKATEGNYQLCDKVMRSFSFDPPLDESL